MASQRVITADVSHLLHERKRKLIRMLSPLARPGFSIDFLQLGQRVVIVAKAGPQVSSNYAEWSFPTMVPNIRASYFESWVQFGPGDDILRIERAYFHLYALRGPAANSEQFLALHCEPGTQNASTLSEDAMATHVHVSLAKYPLNRAHFCLEIGRLTAISESLRTLSASFERGLELIRREILVHPDIQQLTA